MPDNNPVYFNVGDFSVSMQIESGDLVAISAEHPSLGACAVSFAFAAIAVEGDCMVCTMNGRRWICHEVPCEVLMDSSSSDVQD